MEALERKRFLECLKCDTEKVTVDELTYWLPGIMVFMAYKADHNGMRSRDRGSLELAAGGS